MKISKEAKIGALVVVSLSLFVWGFNFLKSNNIFKISDDYIAEFTHIKSLKSSAPIYLNGFIVGHVDDIFRKEDNSGKLVVKLAIKEKFGIPDDSKAVLIDDGLLGSNAINLVLGKSKSNYSPGDILQSEVDGGMMDGMLIQVEGIAEKLDTVLVGVNSILNDSTQQNIAETFENLNLITKNLQQNGYHITKIMSDIAQLTGTLKKKEESISATIDNLKTLSDSLSQAEIGALISQTNMTLAEIDTLVSDINSGYGTLGKLMSDSALYTSLVSTTNSLDSLFIDLKENPKRYVHLSVFGGKD